MAETSHSWWSKVCFCLPDLRSLQICICCSWKWVTRQDMWHQWSRGIRELMWVAHPPSQWIVMWIGRAKRQRWQVPRGHIILGVAFSVLAGACPSLAVEATRNSSLELCSQSFILDSFLAINCAIYTVLIYTHFLLQKFKPVFLGADRIHLKASFAECVCLPCFGLVKLWRCLQAPRLFEASVDVRHSN